MADGGDDVDYANDFEDAALSATSPTSRSVPLSATPSPDIIEDVVFNRAPRPPSGPRPPSTKMLSKPTTPALSVALDRPASHQTGRSGNGPTQQLDDVTVAATMLPTARAARANVEFRKRLVDGKAMLELVEGDDGSSNSVDVGMSASDTQELAALRAQRTLWQEDRTRLVQTQELARAQEEKISRLSRLNEKMTGELKDLHAMVDITLKKVTGGAPIAKAVSSGFLSARGAAPGPAGAGGVSFTHADMASKEYELRNIYNKWTLAQKELSHLRKIIADSNVSVDKVMHLENCVAEKDQLIKALEHKVYIITRRLAELDKATEMQDTHTAHIARLENQVKAAKERTKQVTYLLQEQYRLNMTSSYLGSDDLATPPPPHMGQLTSGSGGTDDEGSAKRRPSRKSTEPL